MTDRPGRMLPWLCAVLAYACGPSARELQLRSATRELGAEVREQRQYNRDLKLRMSLAEARNKVLVNLVQGLTNNMTPPEIGPANASLAALDADLRTLVASVRHSQQDVAAMTAQRDMLEIQLEHARGAAERVHDEQSQEDARNAAYRAVEDQLVPLRARHDIEERFIDRRMIVSVTDVQLFALDEATVLPSAKPMLDQIAEVLASMPSREIQIAAHTDSRPMRKRRFPDKWRLSAERALSVLLYLADRGVPKQHLAAIAYADTHPAMDFTEADQYRNGRIEIILLPNLDELPDLPPAEPAPPAERRPLTD